MSDKPNSDVLVLSGGKLGAAAAYGISRAGYRVVIATERSHIGNCGSTDLAIRLTGSDSDPFIPFPEKLKADRNIDVWTNTDVSQVRGFVGDFQVVLQRAGETNKKTFGAIVATSDIRTKGLAGRYHLTGKRGVISFAELEKMLASTSREIEGKTIALLHGLQIEANPLEFDRLLTVTSKLLELNNRVFAFVNNLKLTAFPLDQKYHAVRAKGAIFVKSPGEPDFFVDGDPLQIEFFDSALARKIKLTPDMIGVDQEYLPDEKNSALTAKLGIRLSKNKFLQAENVHNLTVRTNRKGVFVIGAGKQVQGADDSLADVENVVHELDRLFRMAQAEERDPFAEVDPEKCVICLTCYRSCQHNAITWVDGIAKVYEPACFGCGICASECPMNAIQVTSYSDQALGAKIGEITLKPGHLIAFCCKNSAIEAHDAALKSNFDSPLGLEMVELPCAGKLDAELIMEALIKGADGVMVLGCHPGNCKSEKGSIFARRRVEEVRRMLETTGIEKERVQFGTLAANMGSAFRKLTTEMSGTIRELGPCALKE